MDTRIFLKNVPTVPVSELTFVGATLFLCEVFMENEPCVPILRCHCLLIPGIFICIIVTVLVAANIPGILCVMIAVGGDSALRSRRTGELGEREHTHPAAPCRAILPYYCCDIPYRVIPSQRG